VRKTVVRLGVVAIAAVSISSFNTVPAAADPVVTPLACPTENYYDITSQKSIHLPAGGTYYKDGPGGTMQVSVTRATMITATGTLTGGATFKGIVAEAKVEVSASIAEANTITVGHTYTRTISNNKYGNMQYGSWGWQVGWRYLTDTPQCTTKTRGTGTAKLPSSGEGWRYWETN
jgi:hypothetical protein